MRNRSEVEFVVKVCRKYMLNKIDETKIRVYTDLLLDFPTEKELIELRDNCSDPMKLEAYNWLLGETNKESLVTALTQMIDDLTQKAATLQMCTFEVMKELEDYKNMLGHVEKIHEDVKESDVIENVRKLLQF